VSLGSLALKKKQEKEIELEEELSPNSPVNGER